MSFHIALVYFQFVGIPWTDSGPPAKLYFPNIRVRNIKMRSIYFLQCTLAEKEKKKNSFTVKGDVPPLTGMVESVASV